LLSLHHMLTRFPAGCDARTETAGAVHWDPGGGFVRNEAGGRKGTTKFTARGPPKNAGRRIKKLDSPGVAPYHTSMHGGCPKLGCSWCH
jgi:hypothetical protein